MAKTTHQNMIQQEAPTKNCSRIEVEDTRADKSTTPEPTNWHNPHDCPS